MAHTEWLGGRPGRGKVKPLGPVAPKKRKTGTKANFRQSTAALYFLYKCTFSLPGLGIRIKAERVLEARSYCALYFANHGTAQPSPAKLGGRCSLQPQK